MQMSGHLGMQVHGNRLFSHRADADKHSLNAVDITELTARTVELSE